MGVSWHCLQVPRAPLPPTPPSLEPSAILFSIRSINFWTLNPLHGINHCSQADNSSSPGAITPGFHSRRDWRLSLLAAIKLHSFSNYFVALLFPREFRGLAAFCAHRLPVAPYLQPRGPSIPPPPSGCGSWSKMLSAHVCQAGAFAAGLGGQCGVPCHQGRAAGMHGISSFGITRITGGGSTRVTQGNGG